MMSPMLDIPELTPVWLNVFFGFYYIKSMYMYNVFIIYIYIYEVQKNTSGLWPRLGPMRFRECFWPPTSFQIEIEPQSILWLILYMNFTSKQLLLYYLLVLLNSRLFVYSFFFTYYYAYMLSFPVSPHWASRCSHSFELSLAGLRCPRSNSWWVWSLSSCFRALGSNL